VLEHWQIQAILPHGHPMVLVDRIISLVPGDSIVGEKAVTASEPCFRDPSRCCGAEGFAYPSSLLLESFGQTAAILWLTGEEALAADEESIVMLAATRQCRFEGRAFPGDVIRHVARLESTIGDHVFVAGESWVRDRRIATFGSIVAVKRPRSWLAVSRDASTVGRLTTSVDG
jgi:3-hydroxyacyl-[acyl-carrier-protein] dehydratase